jgi:heptosyltransferase-3
MTINQPALADLQPRRILCMYVARFGDTLLMSVVLKALAKQYPNAAIDFLGHSKRIQVLENLPFIRHLGAISKKSAQFKGWCAKLMGRKPYDVAFVWGHDAELVDYAKRVSRHVVISSQCNQKRINQVDAVIDYPADTLKIREEDDKPLTQWLLDIPEKSLGFKADDPTSEYMVTLAERALALELLQSATRSQPLPMLIGLVVESHPSAPHRDWPLEKFTELTARVHQKYPEAWFVVISGGLAAAKLKQLKAAAGDQLAEFGSRLSMRDSVAMMSLLDLYIGVDTGPTLFAAALGIPAVTMFHCMRAGHLVVNPKQPANMTIIDHPKPRCQCTLQTAMGELDVDTVYAAAVQRLGLEAEPHA